MAKAKGSELLREWREKEGINQTEAAEMLGIWNVQLSRYENARIRPSIGTAIKIQKVCGIPVTAWE
jgi:transcriptional regulator with XRE-family HTH domain